MGLNEDLKSHIIKTLGEPWSVRNASDVPTPELLGLGNEGARLDAAVLYADLTDSTGLVDQYDPRFAAVVYKTYLHCAAKIVRANRGEVTAYDGDRIMAVFIGAQKCSRAATAALQLNFARTQILNPALAKAYPETPYVVRHTVGIDTSMLFVAREGIRGANDLVWVGRAANHAAKLTNLSAETPTWITSDVYAQLDPTLRKYEGHDVWVPKPWRAHGDQQIYCSTWTYTI